MDKQAMQDFITTQLATLTTHEDWVKRLKTLSKLHRYSFTNRILIAVQDPDATYVAGFKAWSNNFARTVKKGEHGIKIFAPLTRKVIDPTTQEETRQIFGFKLATVFDVRQTEGKEFVLPHAPTPLTGDSHAALLDTILQTIPIPYHIVPADQLGYANGDFNLRTHEIRIRADLSINQQVKTALHEWSHSLAFSEDPTLDRLSLPRDWEECAAESTAFLISHLLGLDSTEYSAAYIAGWSHTNTDILLQLTEEIAHRVDTIMTALPAALTAEPVIAVPAPELAYA